MGTMMLISVMIMTMMAMLLRWERECQKRLSSRFATTSSGSGASSFPSWLFLAFPSNFYIMWVRFSTTSNGSVYILLLVVAVSIISSAPISVRRASTRWWSGPRRESSTRIRGVALLWLSGADSCFGELLHILAREPYVYAFLKKWLSPKSVGSMLQ